MAENGELGSLGSDVNGLPCLKWEHHTHRAFKNNETDKRNIQDFSFNMGNSFPPSMVWYFLSGQLVDMSQIT